MDPATLKRLALVALRLVAVLFAWAVWFILVTPGWVERMEWDRVQVNAWMGGDERELRALPPRF